MSLEKVREYFEKYGMSDRIIEFSESSATVHDAAKAAGCSEGEIAKSLSFMVGETPILIIAAGDVKIDNAKYRGEFSVKAKMLPYESVEEIIGHAPGGVCPFAVNEGVEVYLDESPRLDGWKRKCSAARVYADGKYLGKVINNDGRDPDFPSPSGMNVIQRADLLPIGDTEAEIKLESLRFYYAWDERSLG